MQTLIEMLLVWFVLSIPAGLGMGRWLKAHAPEGE